MNAVVLWALIATAAGQQPTVVIIVGAPGTPEYEGPFRRWAERWQEAAVRGGARCVTIGLELAEGTSARDQLAELLDNEPAEADAPLWLVLIGHGTFDGRTARFNLQGPDLSAALLARWLERFRRTVVVINCASSSAPFINRLSGPERIIFTATKSGYQSNYARFGDYLSAAIGDPAADLDKDQQTSLLEAFLLASRRTAEFYETQGRLATETALVDDNGDGRGTPAAAFERTLPKTPADAAEPDGQRASQLCLIPSRAEAHMPAPVRRRRDQLEQAIAALRRSKDQIGDPDRYYAQLEPLLVELARLYEGLHPESDDSPQSDAHD